MPCKATFIYLSLSAILFVTKCQNVESSEIINTNDEKDYTPNNDGITTDNPNTKSPNSEIESELFNNEDKKLDPITPAKEDNQSVPEKPKTTFREGREELSNNENLELDPIMSAEEDNQSVPKTHPLRIRDGDRPFKYYRKGIKTRNSVASENVQKGMLKMVTRSSVEDASFDFKKVAKPSDEIEERIIKQETKKRPRFKLRKKNHSLRFRNKSQGLNNNKNNNDGIPTETQQYNSHTRRNGSPVLYMRNHGSSSSSEVDDNKWSTSEKVNLHTDYENVESMKNEDSSQENILTLDKPANVMTNDAEDLNKYYEILSNAGENAEDDSNTFKEISSDTKAFIPDSPDESFEKTSISGENEQKHLPRDVGESVPSAINEDKVQSQINNDHFSKPQFVNGNYKNEYKDDLLKANGQNEVNEYQKSTTFQRPEPQQRGKPFFEILDEKKSEFDVLGERQVVDTLFQRPSPPEGKQMVSKIHNKENKENDSIEENKETPSLQEPRHQERRQFRYEENRKNFGSLEEKQRGTVSQKPFPPEEEFSYFEGHTEKVNLNIPKEDESSVSQIDLNIPKEDESSVSQIDLNIPKEDEYSVSQIDPTTHSENREVKLHNENSKARETSLEENLYEDPSESKINYKENRIPAEHTNLNTYSNDFKTTEDVSNFDKVNSGPSFDSGTVFGANPPHSSIFQNSFKSNTKPNFPSNKNTLVIRAALMNTETRPTDFRKFEESKKKFKSQSNVYPLNQEINNNENYNARIIPGSTLSPETPYNYEVIKAHQPLFRTYSESGNSQALDTHNRFQEPSAQDYPDSSPHQILKDSHPFDSLEGHTSHEQPEYSFHPNLNNNFPPSEIQQISHLQNNFQEEGPPHPSQDGYSTIHQLGDYFLEGQQNEQQNQLPIFHHQNHQQSVGQSPNQDQQYHEVDYEVKESEPETSSYENIKSTDEHYLNSFESQELLEEAPEQLLHSIQPSEFEYENQQEEIHYKSNPEDYEVSSFQEPNQQSFSYHDTKNLVFPILNHNSNKPTGNQNPFAYSRKESGIQEGPSNKDHQQILSVGHSNFQNSQRGSQNTASIHHLQPLFKETRTENVQSFHEPVMHLNPLFKQIRTETAPNFNQPKINSNNGIATANMHFKLMSPYVEI